MTRATKKRTAFVTGGTGFVGSNLIEELIRQDWSVIALHRPGSDVANLIHQEITLVQGDITNSDSLSQALPENVDAVFHVAGDTNTWARGNDRQTVINVDGTRNMINAAKEKRAGCFIFTSTSVAYGLQVPVLSEATISRGGQSWINYIRTKWLAEEEVRKGAAEGLDTVIINPNAILGPRDQHGWASLFFAIRDGKLKGLPPGIATYNHVTEVVRAHIFAVDHGKRGANYLLTGDVAPLAEMIKIMAELQGVDLAAKVASSVMLKMMARLNVMISSITGNPPDITPEMAELMCTNFICDTRKAEQDLRYKSVPLRTCVTDSYNWLKSEGVL